MLWISAYQDHLKSKTAFVSVWYNLHLARPIKAMCAPQILEPILCKLSSCIDDINIGKKYDKLKNQTTRHRGCLIKRRDSI